MNHKQMIRIMAEKMPMQKIADRLHVGKSIVYYWMHGDRNPGYHAGKAIEKLYKQEEKKHHG